MAVDANVLIFERIREELALGLTPPKAIKAGFERANLSIVDSNLTTIIVAGPSCTSLGPARCAALPSP